MRGAHPELYILITHHFNGGETQGGFTNLVGKSLRWVVYDHRLGEISPEDVKVFDVVALYAYAVFAKQSVPEIPEERHWAEGSP